MRVKRFSTPFQALISFLNLDPERLSGRLRERLITGPEAKEHFRTVQERVRKDILSIIESANPAEVEANLRRVIAKIEAMKIQSLLGVWRWNSRTRKFLSRVPVVSLGHEFEINGVKLFTFETPNTRSLEEIHYWDLFRVLRNGEFSRLRKCPNCPRFHLKRKFCSDRCRVACNNTLRKKTGYFTNAWKKRRKVALTKAKNKLPSDGQRVSAKLLERICQETKLTPRILRSARLIERADGEWFSKGLR